MRVAVSGKVHETVHEKSKTKRGKEGFGISISIQVVWFNVPQTTAFLYFFILCAVLRCLFLFSFFPSFWYIVTKTCLMITTSCNDSICVIRLLITRSVCQRSMTESSPRKFSRYSHLFQEVNILVTSLVILFETLKAPVCSSKLILHPCRLSLEWRSEVQSMTGPGSIKNE